MPFMAASHTALLGAVFEREFGFIREPSKTPSSYLIDVGNRLLNR